MFSIAHCRRPLHQCFFLIQKQIGDAPEKTVSTPSENYLLLQKLETFLDRHSVKARDAFDIRFLVLHGAEIYGQLQAHLEDGIKMKDIGDEDIEKRITNVSDKLCKAELRTVLPPAIFEGLAKDEFGAIRQSLRRVFANWLPESSHELDDDPDGRSS